MPSPSADVMDTSSQYSSCETLDSHRSSEADERSEVNGNDGQRPSRKVRKLLRYFAFDCFALFVPVLVSLSLDKQISVEHTDYIQKERITRAAPPKPAYNPMQFVAIKPSNLFQSAQEQLKKAEEIRKTKEVVRKEEPEDWQNVSSKTRDARARMSTSKSFSSATRAALPIELGAEKKLELMHRLCLPLSRSFHV